MKVLACGFVVADLILTDLVKFPRPGEVVYNLLGAQLRSGGNPANIAVDLMQLGCLEGEIGVLGSVGVDMFGEFIESYLIEKGVSVFFTKSQKIQTSKAVILVANGEDRRTILGLGANTEMSFDYVTSKISEYSPKIFYQASGVLGGYESRVREIFKQNRDRGIINVFDFIRPYNGDWDSIIESFEFTDIVHCNEYEIRQLTGMESIKKGLKAIGKKGAGMVIASLGKSGICAYIPKPNIFIEQEGFHVQSVDPTGAGDALVAGIMFGILSRESPRNEKIDEICVEDISRIIALGQGCGAACVTAVGTSDGVQKAKVENLFKEQGEWILDNAKFSRR